MPFMYSLELISWPLSPACREGYMCAQTWHNYWQQNGRDYFPLNSYVTEVFIWEAVGPVFTSPTSSIGVKKLNFYGFPD